MTIALALFIGVIAGLRTFTAPTAVAWAARLGRLPLAATPLAFLGYAYTPWIFSALGLIEFVVDQLPSTARRTVPSQFGARIISAALSGGAIGAGAGTLAVGMMAGIAGAVVGTLGGRAARGWLAAAFGSDHPAAFLEDAVAIAAAILVVIALP